MWRRPAARVLAEQDAAVALLDEVTADTLRRAVEPLLSDSLRRSRIGDQARTLGKPNAADHLARVVVEAVSSPRRKHEEIDVRR